jgi:hypothetical protein
MRFVCLFSVLSIVGSGLGCGGGQTDDGSKAKLAGQLVDCNNQVASLKEQLNDSKAALAKAMEAAGMVVKLDPVDIKATAGMQVHHMEGNVKPDAVAKVVKLNAGGLRACYDKALKRKPDLQYVSSVTAKFQVKNSGSAMNVHFAPHTDADMESCMASTMEKWKFPTFEGDPVSFEQPVNLVAK